MKTNRCFVGLCLLVSGGAALTSQANAQMVLTPTAIADGFSLSTFASDFPSSSNIGSLSNIGPLGIAFDGSKVLVSDFPGNVRVFPTDTDGQSAASVPVTHTYTFGNAIGIAIAGGQYYMTQYNAGSVLQINTNGTPIQLIVTGFAHVDGIVANPNNGHLFISTDTGIVDVDPIAKTSKVFQSVRADGLTTDGTTLFAVVNLNHIVGYRLSDGVQVFDSGFIAGIPDGTALGYGKQAGEIFVNTNGGQLLEYNLSGTPVQTVLATGGSRGDFVTVDPTNDTLLITQTDRILRLSGATFTVPEPGPIALLAAGLTGGSLLWRRRRK